MTPAPLNILLVDDRAENLVALEQILQRPDRRLVRASSGNEALRLLLKDDFAVMLLDVEMPEMDGYETARLVRSMERTAALPVIFVTAGDRSDERALRAYELGAVYFLYNPVQPVVLRSKVDMFTELHRRAADLRAANGELERIAGALEDKIADLEFVNRTLSHDLRAPLRSIHGFAQILAESLEGHLDDEDRDHLGRILRACVRMERILDDLFGLLRTSAATAAGAVDAGQVLAGVVESLGTDIARAGATVTHGALPTVHVNPTLLAQILQNLIANALKFAGGQQPAVHVTAERADGAWRFAVHDQGVGIAPEFRERVFGMFERLGGDPTTGAGVGLALCKRAVEKHGGRIWVDSTPGAGSTFYFTIPA
jgi:two-component system, sensor histidine kinase and response regulator